MLTFACEEIEVTNEVSEYDPDTGVCTTSVEDFYYVDFDANGEYDPMIDGQQYDYIFTETIDDTGNTCCRKAPEENDSIGASLTCDCQNEDSDEYYTYQMLECTRKFDRISKCYLSDDLLRLEPIFENGEHCMVEVLDVSECCAAK